ncbi:MAG TPA: SDR family oxidoreductase [Gemmatimonadaceae bacterium]|nr:SDR family oxidoreductase [Gemmatimonadaceae bacterium]
MDLGIAGKVALVAGSSKGLGRAIAEELAREGASLIICSRGEDALIAARDSIVATTGAQVLAVPADVSISSDIQNVVSRGNEHFGRIDILVTNAGGPPSATFENLDSTKWEDAVRLTLMSVVELCSATVPAMKERGWGRVINVTSIAVKQPVAGLMLSNSLRSAVTGFARTLANEVATSGVTVNNVMPGYTQTERVEQLAAAAASREGTTADAARAKWEGEIPMRRLGRPEELAALVAFLASERAGYITGSSIAVDGGWIRGLL